MTNSIHKVRRSALYMPCSNARALEKACSLNADVLIFDLEDAVAADKKQQARENIVQALQERDYGAREKIVRVNSLDSPWGLDDIKALQHSQFDGLLLPKAESVEQINEALAILDKTLPVWVMIETAKGVLRVESLAQHEKVAVLVMGTNDLAKELRVAQSANRAEFSYAFSRCVVAARAYQCDILDGVYNQLDDEAGLKTLCEQGKMLGFDGKTLIHPKQLEVCNRVFSPSQAEIDQAKAIVSSWQASDNKGVIVVDGQLIEELHVKQAQRLIQIAEQSAG